MKITWYESNDNSWQARYYPKTQNMSSAPFSLVARKDGHTEPWHWEVKRQGDLISSGMAEDPDQARRNAHLQLARFINRTCPQF